MPQIDLREYKKGLREKRKAKRISLNPERKKVMDMRIADRITSLYQYKNAKTVMIYASTAIEVDTFEIIISLFIIRKFCKLFAYSKSFSAFAPLLSKV